MMTVTDEEQRGVVDVVLLEQEMALLDPAVRRDSARVRAMLCEEFREFGSSGRVWDLSSILGMMEKEADRESPAVEDFLVERIDASVALVTYRAVRGERTTLRSSLWVNRNGRWRMVFHQGTLAAESGVTTGS